MVDRVEILPVRGIGEVGPGTDLASAITTAAPWLRDGDVLVVTSKIVSKAEGQLVDVPESGPMREAAREAALAAETARVVARRGHTRIVQTHHGFVLASAGIDASNVDRSRLVLLPKDPDASARALRSSLRERFGLNVAVVVSDTMGRPWRIGLTDVALGAAGLDPVHDYRGKRDPYGNEMHLTQMAVIDELSGAAELVKGKFDQVPVAVVRGFLTDAPDEDGPGAAALLREAAQDLFALGTAEARAAGLAEAAALPDAHRFGTAPVNPATITRAIARLGSPTRFEVLPPARDLPPGTAWMVTFAVDPERALTLGADVHRLRCALAAEGLATNWPAGSTTVAVGSPQDRRES
jgi:coenzyme F420-0:L-glutamate ligase/coenzyme F420-1:gamma-L-glutamate ligase